MKSQLSCFPARGLWTNRLRFQSLPLAGNRVRAMPHANPHTPLGSEVAEPVLSAGVMLFLHKTGLQGLE